MTQPENKLTIPIRLATPADAGLIASILSQAFAEYAPLYTPAGLAATTPSAEVIQTRLSEGPVWLAMQNDRPLGTVAAVLKNEGLYVRSMALLPDARGQGIGRLLLQAVESFADEHDVRRLFLSTTPFLTQAIRLYERFGFQRSAEGPHELFGTPLFTLEKFLVVRGESPNVR